MLIYLYGLPGAGKNFIGEVYKSKFNFYFQDADEYLPEKMKNKLKQGKHFTVEDVKEYHYIIADKIYKLKKEHQNLIISQASLFSKHRQIIKDKNPSIEFIYINSDRNTIIKRLNHRKGYVTQKYMLDLEKYLEIDKNNYFINNKSHDTIDSITIQILKITNKNLLQEEIKSH
jgi:carbohydrate kinase (thermoresistant glucokinase family)